MTCEYMIVKAIDDLRDNIRRGSSFSSIVNYIKANYLHSPEDEAFSLHLRKIISFSLKSLLLQGHVSMYPHRSHTTGGCSRGGFYRVSKALKRKRVQCIIQSYQHETTCRTRLLGQTVHPFKERTSSIINSKRVKRKVFITKCKLCDSKILSVTYAFIFKHQYMDFDDENHKIRRRLNGRHRRHKSSSVVKTQLLLKTKTHIQ